MLCRTCRMYPRHIEEYEGIREISLSLSCVEAAKIILGGKEPVRFLNKEDDREETYESFDFFLFTKLMDVREAMIGILQDRKESMEVRIVKVLAIAHDVQRRIRGEALFEIDQLLERYQKEKNLERFREKLDKFPSALLCKLLFQTAQMLPDKMPHLVQTASAPQILYRASNPPLTLPVFQRLGTSDSLSHNVICFLV